MSPEFVTLDNNSAYVQTRGTAGFFSDGPPKESSSYSLFARWQVGHWIGQPEVGYTYILSSPISYQPPPTSLSSSFIGNAQNHNFEVGRLSVNVLTGFSVGAGRHWYALAGPGVSRRVAGAAYRADQPTAFGKELCEQLNQAPERVSYQAIGAVGYWGLANVINLEARFSYGLTPLVRSFTYRGQVYPLQAQAHVLLLTVGYALPSKH